MIRGFVLADDDALADRDPDVRRQVAFGQAGAIVEPRIDTAPPQHRLRRQTALEADDPPGKIAACKVDRPTDVSGRIAIHPLAQRRGRRTNRHAERCKADQRRSAQQLHCRFQREGAAFAFPRCGDAEAVGERHEPGDLSLGLGDAPIVPLRCGTSRLIGILSLAAMFNPAMAMLLAACRAVIGAQPLDHRPLGHDEWNDLLIIARRHRVEALLAAGLAQMGVIAPPEIGATLGRAVRDNAVAVLRAVDASRAIDNALRAAGIDHLFVKGLALGQLAYEQIALKSAIDIDLLVASSSIDGAATVLESLDYRLAEPSTPGRSELLAWHALRKESVWVADDGRPPVDLHGRLADQPLLIPTIGLESPRQSVEIAPGVHLDTIATPDLIAYLAVHGASSAWFRLKWLADITALLLRAGPDRIEPFYRSALQLGAGRSIGLALLLGQRLFGLPLPRPLSVELEGDRTLRWLAAIALRQIAADEPTERMLGTLQIHLSQFFLRRGFRFKQAEAARQWQSIAANRRYRAPS